MSDTITRSAAELPIACSLPEDEQATRGEALAADLFSGCQQIEELPDGYAFRFAGSDEWIAKLTEFIAAERRCCPFFTFELVCEPAEGPIWLRLRGPEGVKPFIQSFTGAGPSPSA